MDYDIHNSKGAWIESFSSYSDKEAIRYAQTRYTRGKSLQVSNLRTGEILQKANPEVKK